MNETTQWAKLKPLRPDSPGELPFPVNALPSILRDMTSAIATTTSTDSAIAGNVCKNTWKIFKGEILTSFVDSYKLKREEILWYSLGSDLNNKPDDIVFGEKMCGDKNYIAMAGKVLSLKDSEKINDERFGMMSDIYDNEQKQL